VPHKFKVIRIGESPHIFFERIVPKNHNAMGKQPVYANVIVVFGLRLYYIAEVIH